MSNYQELNGSGCLQFRLVIAIRVSGIIPSSATILASDVVLALQIPYLKYLTRPQATKNHSSFQ
jgi:hypothetical protein